MRNIEKKIVPCNVLGCKFASQRAPQQCAGLFVGKPQSEHVHQLRDGRLGGHVVAAGHADPLQAESRFVEFHHDPPAPALRDVENDQSPADRLFEHVDEPFAGRGVSCAEVNPYTMESLKIRGLYFAGEVLDLDANTGGYNLQIAFSTGRLAGLLKK